MICISYNNVESLKSLGLNTEALINQNNAAFPFIIQNIDNELEVKKFLEKTYVAHEKSNFTSSTFNSFDDDDYDIEMYGISPYENYLNYMLKYVAKQYSSLCDLIDILKNSSHTIFKTSNEEIFTFDGWLEDGENVNFLHFTIKSGMNPSLNFKSYNLKL